MGSIVNYMAAFCARHPECSDISDAEVLDHYVAGLKTTAQDWVLIHNPRTMRYAAKWAEWYDNTYFAKSHVAASSSASPG